MSSRLVAVRFDAHDAAVLAAFWAGVLGREIVAEASGALLPGDDTQVGLRFITAATEKHGQNRLHLHLTSSTLDDQRHTVERLLRLGGRHLDVGQLAEEDHVVLADPGGNAFCVIEPGNNFLAGCGFFGEVSCIGSREVGLFWRDALDWPLVWDRDGETAVQSPRGGTKVSWGGPPVAPRLGGTANASTSLRRTSLRRCSDWSRSVPPSSAAGTAASSWPTPTATNSRSAPASALTSP